MAGLQDIGKRNKRKYKGKRLGRGYGSGVGGHTVGRGQKGQLSRSGHKSTLGFEGGNVPIYRRMPVFRGFKNINRKEYFAVNISDLEANFKSGDVVTLDALKEKTLVKSREELVKILGFGEIKKKITVKGLPVSKSAEEKILAAGGKVE